MAILPQYQPQLEQALKDCKSIKKTINNKKLSFDNLEETLTVLATNIEDIALCILSDIDPDKYEEY